MKGEALTYTPGQIIFREGDPSNGIYFIKDGKVDIFREKDGVEVSFAVLVQGDIIGTLTLFSKEPRTASARAIMNSSLTFISSISLDKAVIDIPIWIKAILKDTIARLKNIDDKLVNSKISEKKLGERVGTSIHHSSQLASLLENFVKIGKINDEGICIYPIQHFIVIAEKILLRRAEYLQAIFDAFIKGGLIKIIENNKYNKSMIVNENKIFLLKDYALFSLSVIKQGTKEFIPFKYINYLNYLIHIYKKYPNKETWNYSELINIINKELSKSISSSIILELAKKKYIEYNTSLETIKFISVKMQKRIIFENVIRLVMEYSENNISAWEIY